jgi:hypothetical protein
MSNLFYKKSLCQNFRLTQRLDSSKMEQTCNNSLQIQNKLLLVDSIKITISALKDYVSYTLTNTPFPPLNNVPKRGSSL